MNPVRFHPTSEIFPQMLGADFQRLVDDIRANGLREPIVVHEGQILDGRNRYRACIEAGVEPRYEDWKPEGSPLAYVISLNLHRRHLDESQRAMIAARLANMRQGERSDLSPIGEKLSQQSAADLMNVGKRSVERAKKVCESGTPELVEAVERGELPVSTAAEVARLPEQQQRELVESAGKGELAAGRLQKRAMAKRREMERAAEQAAAVAGNHPLDGEAYRLVHSDFRDISSEIADGSVDAIITDPPYGREHVPLYEDLSEFAARVLRDGGHCLVMCGQAHLPDIIGLLGRNLRYHWMMAYLLAGPPCRMAQKRIFSQWKPIIWLTRDGIDSAPFVNDILEGSGRDKRFHEWGQSVGGMAELVERFTAPKALVVDPFCGAGTTGVAAVRLDRLFLGIDSDEAAIVQAAKRLEEASGMEEVVACAG